MREITKGLAAKLAKLRRNGGTWSDVSEAAGFTQTSTGWAESLAAHGFDKLGRQGGKGESKARGWGSATNGTKPKTKAKAKPKAKTTSKPKAKPKKRVVRKPKAKVSSGSGDPF